MPFSMIRKSLAFFAILSASAMLCCAALEWESTRLDLPAKVGQEEIVGVFKFENTGETPVEILTTRSSCGCTVPELTKNVYAPGESGEIKAVFTVGSRVGPQRKTITVTTDAPDQRVTRLILSTKIPEIATIRPKMLLWRNGSELEWKETVIKTDAENKVSIPKLDEGQPKLPTHELLPTETPGEYKLRIKPENTTERYQIQFPVVVTLPDDEKKTVKLHVMVR